MEAHALRAGIPKAAFTPRLMVRQRRWAYAPAICHGGTCAPRRHPGSRLCAVPQGPATAIGIRARHLPWRHMRSAPAYPKQPLLRASWFGSGDWHTRPPSLLIVNCSFLIFLGFTCAGAGILISYFAPELSALTIHGGNRLAL
jgi:hypothetical protein